MVVLNLRCGASVRKWQILLQKIFCIVKRKLALSPKGCGRPRSENTALGVMVAFLVQRSIPLRPPGGAPPPSSLVVGSVRPTRGAASSLGLRSRLCSSRSKSAIRWGIVLGTSDRAASSRATAAWISLIIRCLRAECRVPPVPCLRAMRAPRARRMPDTTPDIAFSFRNGTPARLILWAL